MRHRPRFRHRCERSNCWNSRLMGAAPRYARPFVAIFVGMVVVCALAPLNLWPFSNWELFSRLRGPVESYWEAVVEDHGLVVAEVMDGVHYGAAPLLLLVLVVIAVRLRPPRGEAPNVIAGRSGSWLPSSQADHGGRASRDHDDLRGLGFDSRP
jgi:hypothetical protein